MRSMKKLAAGLFAVVLAGSSLLSAPVSAAGMSFEELRQKFPDGKYWNHLSTDADDPNHWTSTPCDHTTDNGKVSCNTAMDMPNRIGGKQCFGYAMQITMDIYGESFYGWPQDTNLSTIKPGDCLRLFNDGHSIVVQEVKNDTLYYTDCNNGNTCLISWDCTFPMSTVKSNLTYIAHAPYAAPQTAADVPAQLLGDVNGDKSVNASDAALVLTEAALTGAGNAGTFTAAQKTAANVNKDSTINASDAAYILTYAAIVGAGSEAKWEDIIR